MVAAKYQQGLTEEKFSIFKKEPDRLVESEGGKSKGKSNNLPKLTPCGLMWVKTFNQDESRWYGNPLEPAL